MSPINPNDHRISRRNFLKVSAGVGGLLVTRNMLPEIFVSRQAPALIRWEAAQPQMPYGVASGDIMADQAIIWSRADRAARMIVEISTTESMKDAKTIVGPAALEVSDYTAKLNLTDLPPGQDVFYRVTFQSLEDLNAKSQPVTGRFRTAPVNKRSISFLWSGDEAGQGWGINPDWGGMKIYKAMAALDADFFVHSGDMIYADGPMQTEVKLDDGTMWKNIVTPEKSKVAETLQEYRGNFAYNLMDTNIQAFNASLPLIVQWDDHETLNNWYPTKSMTNDTNNDKYKEKSVALLSARSKQAFFEYNPIRINGQDHERIYRSFNYGPLLDVFMLDERSYRGPNSPNDQEVRGPDTDFMGRPQLQWLKEALLASKSTWKVIASDMPIGLIVADGTEKKNNFEAFANGDGPARGRELELVDLLRFIKYNDIHNVVWLTADVHYTSAQYYDPNKAQFSDFNPFYEFVSGPLNAGTFGPNKLDNTFGPQVLFQKAPEAGKANLPPSAGYQFFGQVQIDGQTEVLTVTLRDLDGKSLFAQKIDPVL